MVAAPQQAVALQTPLSAEQRAALWLQGSGGAQLRRDSPRSYAELAAAAVAVLPSLLAPRRLALATTLAEALQQEHFGGSDSSSSSSSSSSSGLTTVCLELLRAGCCRDDAGGDGDGGGWGWVSDLGASLMAQVKIVFFFFFFPLFLVPLLFSSLPVMVSKNIIN